MNKLREIVYLLNDGKIQNINAVKILEKYLDNEERDQDRHRDKLAGRLVGYMQRTTSESPEHIYLEKEKINEILEIYEYVLSLLPSRQQELLNLYFKDEMPIMQCAEIMDIDRTTCLHTLKNIHRKVFKLCQESPELSIKVNALYNHLTNKESWDSNEKIRQIQGKTAMYATF